jgi:hypothetical protein
MIGKISDKGKSVVNSVKNANTTTQGDEEYSKIQKY